MRADARHIPLRDGCVQCVVTSPPYWGLRDYGVIGQIGLEPTPEAYVATMVQVFREVRRVLRDDGTVWLNLGDSYNANNRWGGDQCVSQRQLSNKGTVPFLARGADASLGRNADGASAMVDGGLSIQIGNSMSTSKESEGTRSVESGQSNPRYDAITPTVLPLKPKNLIGIPWRVAFALQADGWYLRSDIIWAKPNPMPESVTDRPTRSHEYIFLLSKQPRYFYDADAIREQWADDRNGASRASSTHSLRYSELSGRNGDSGLGTAPPFSGRNRRSVWTINSEPTPEAHFATFPQKLVEPCILAGTSEKGCCAECGAPRVRVTSTDYEIAGRGNNNGAGKGHDGTGTGAARMYETRMIKRITTTGWQPSCAHDAPSVPCLVFDPFAGAGTTLKVARRFGRRAVGLELSADYIEIARRRTSQGGFSFLPQATPADVPQDGPRGSVIEDSPHGRQSSLGLNDEQPDREGRGR